MYYRLAPNSTTHGKIQNLSGNDLGSSISTDGNIISEGELALLLERLERHYRSVIPQFEEKARQLHDDLTGFFHLIPSQIDPFAYGVVEIKHRTKSAESLIRNYRLHCDRDPRGFLVLPPSGPFSRATLESFALAEAPASADRWCEVFGDIIGVRIITRSQRGKYQIFRAIEYLLAIGAIQRLRKQRLNVPVIEALPECPWKYFNRG